MGSYETTRQSALPGVSQSYGGGGAGAVAVGGSVTGVSVGGSGSGVLVGGPCGVADGCTGSGVVPPEVGAGGGGLVGGASLDPAEFAKIVTFYQRA